MNVSFCFTLLNYRHIFNVDLHRHSVSAQWMGFFRSLQKDNLNWCHAYIFTPFVWEWTQNRNYVPLLSSENISINKWMKIVAPIKVSLIEI